MAFNPQGIFEVHLAVKDRHVSTDFYMRVLGCELATHIDRRDITFLWMNGYGSTMIGLWGPECPDPPIERAISHIAFRLSAEDVEKAPAKLRELGVQSLGFNGESVDEAIVLAWMPAVSVYFKDPDGHSLEFISMLSEASRPDLDIVKLSEWKNK
jgi:lactoylglutathione lyase